MAQLKQPYRRVQRSGKSSYGPRTKTVAASSLLRSEQTSRDERIESTRLAHSIDERMGFPRFEAGKKRVGWLVNMKPTTIEDEKVPGGRAGVDYFFIGGEENGEGAETFKATVEYEPYFLIAIKRGKEQEVEEWCKRAFEGLIKGIKRLEKEDLQMPNHLLGYRRTLLQLSFSNVNDLLSVRKTIMPIAEKNKSKMNAMDTYAEMARYVRKRFPQQFCLWLPPLTTYSANAGFDIFDDEQDYEKRYTSITDASDFITDIREYDVPYHVRVAIDKG